MKHYTPSPLNKVELENKETGDIKKLFIQKTVIHELRYDKNCPASQSDQRAEELFSSFTANIIKEETLFIR